MSDEQRSRLGRLGQFLNGPMDTEPAWPLAACLTGMMRSFAFSSLILDRRPRLGAIRTWVTTGGGTYDVASINL